MGESAVLVLVDALDFVSAGLGEGVGVHLALVQVDVTDHVPADKASTAHAEVGNLSIHTANCLEKLDVGEVEVHLLIDLFEIAFHFDPALELDCDSN